MFPGSGVWDLTPHTDAAFSENRLGCFLSGALLGAFGAAACFALDRHTAGVRGFGSDRCREARAA